jgi:hypothetical protein
VNASHNLKNIVAMIKLNTDFFRFVSVQREFISKVENELIEQPLTSEEILTESELMHLPAPVQKYIADLGIKLNFC